MKSLNVLNPTEAELLRVYCVLQLGRKIDRTEPLVDIRLLDGSRVNAIIPPCPLNVPTSRRVWKRQASASAVKSSAQALSAR
jgi:Flp pilus assembly CpaF family ATPase